MHTKCIEWPVQEGETKLAAVNSFGYEGSNAHLIVKEPMKSDSCRSIEDSSNSKENDQRLRIFTLSARSLSGIVDSAK